MDDKVINLNDGRFVDDDQPTITPDVNDMKQAIQYLVWLLAFYENLRTCDVQMLNSIASRAFLVPTFETFRELLSEAVEWAGMNKNK
jgi:hypothetical protein